METLDQLEAYLRLVRPKKPDEPKSTDIIKRSDMKSWVAQREWDEPMAVEPENPLVPFSPDIYPDWPKEPDPVEPAEPNELLKEARAILAYRPGPSELDLEVDKRRRSELRALHGIGVRPFLKKKVDEFEEVHEMLPQGIMGKTRARWDVINIDKYEGVIPDNALKLAIEIKKYFKTAKFRVRMLDTSKPKYARTKFLSVTINEFWFTIATWED